MNKEKQIDLLERQLAFWKHHSTVLAKALEKEEEISNHYAQMLDKTEEELNEERVKNEEHGYRKQSEWISVDDRLPEDDLPKDTDRRTIRCLVATNKGTVKACVRQRYISPSNGKLTPWCWSKDVYAKPTHWMPLPEPPKMKGGVE